MSKGLSHDRADQVIGELVRQNADLAPEWRQQKFVRMSESPFSFFRGSNHLYWYDVYRDWRFSLYGGVKATQTWLLGDVHIVNFGAYGSHDRVVRYGLDDFDDALVADYQYDLWRLGISLVLSMREEGKSEKAVAKALAALSDTYLETLGEGEDQADWVATPDTADGLLGKFLLKVSRKKSREKMLRKWTTVDDSGVRRFQQHHHKLERLDEATAKALTQALNDYQETLDDEVPGHSHQHFAVKDVARRINAGTGSLGCDRYYALIEGRAEGDKDDVILDIKAQSAPAALLAMSEAERREYSSLYKHEGERHALAFKALARHPDPYVGWLEFDRQVFSVRERSPFKADYPVTELGKSKRWREMARNWARILAASHLRGATALGMYDFAEAVLEMARDRKRFKQMFTETACDYATCVQRDYEIFCRYLDSDSD